MDIVSESSGAQAPKDESNGAPDLGMDTREQLVNEGKIGPIGLVSIQEVMITKLRGIMLDFDRNLYKTECLPVGATDSPQELFEKFVGPMLERHPVYDKAEVRNSGNGLHAILKFEPHVEFKTEADRVRWAAIVMVVQKALPTDRHAPGITATTRPVGSINSKNGRTVTILKEGKPLAQAEVLKLVADLSVKPFKLVAEMVLGPGARCPMCTNPGSRLGILEKSGRCYEGKHRPSVGDVFDAFYKPRSAAREA